MQARKHIILLSTEQAAQDLRGCSLDQDRVARCDHQIFDLGAGIDPGRPLYSFGHCHIWVKFCIVLQHQCTMCILGSMMALWSKAEIQKYTF